MKINYSKILKSNMINAFKDVLINIKNNGLQEGHHLYITFKTNSKKTIIPQWLLEKYPNEITIVIKHEYCNYDVAKDHFKITLSFSDVKADLIIGYDAIISFADPYANFGLRLEQKTTNEFKNKINSKKKNSNNVIDFINYKKN